MIGAGAVVVEVLATVDDVVGSDSGAVAVLGSEPGGTLESGVDVLGEGTVTEADCVSNVGGVEVVDDAPGNRVVATGVES